MSYQRDGAPRGYMVWNFHGNQYNDQFRASGKDEREQMHLSFFTPSWNTWFDTMRAYANLPLPRPLPVPLTLNNLPDQGTVKQSDLEQIILVANVWNSSRDSIVSCNFDSETKVHAEKNLTIGDPYAQRLQSYIFRYAMGFEMFGITISLPGTPPQPIDGGNLMKESFHVWTCSVPTDLGPGVHDVVVSTMDVHDNSYSQRMVFEVVE